MAKGFMLDMGISPLVGKMLDRRDIAWTHALHEGLDRAADEQILAEANRRDYAVLTSDNDLAAHVAVRKTGSPSVVTLRLDNPSAKQQSMAIEALLNAVSVDKIENSLIALEANRYRIRRLPI